MEQKEFYEVDGCSWFIPVDLIEENKCTKELEVVTTESGRITFVPTIYKFRKPPEPQKVVVPLMILDTIESFDEDIDNLHDYISRQPFEVKMWIAQNERDFYKAWLAYSNITVEQEKLYTVEIPDPNSIWKYTFLTNRGPGVSIDRTDGDFWKDDSKNQLTESEIKQDFEWAWQWAKEVE